MAVIYGVKGRVSNQNAKTAQNLCNFTINRIISYTKELPPYQKKVLSGDKPLVKSCKD